MTTHIDTDYLVIGAGATAMAFVDTLLTESKATVTMVDRFHRPGGHWNMAYPYVRLHQPSAMYGVNSRPLGEDRIDKVGWNAGLYELASAAEICSYFDHIMQQTFQPSGRVSYFPMAEYTGDGTFHLTTSGKEYGVTARKIVDTTYQDVSVPAMRPPEFPVEDTITVVPPNDLPAIRNPYERYVVIGAGKTGIDACLWLLEQGLDPEDITWIMPRSPWLLDRALVQPIPLRHAEDIAIEYAAKHDAIMNAESVPDLFDRLDAIGALLRRDPDERPTAFRCATVSRSELEQLRRITDVVRLGRIKRITKTAIELNNGEIPTGDHVLHVDCTADAVKQLPPVPIFQNGRITLQSVRVCQPAFSAALVAHVETTYADDGVKNDLCPVTPNPRTHTDWLRYTISANSEQVRWAGNTDLAEWMHSSRLHPNMAPPTPEDPGDRAEFVRQAVAMADMQNQKLEELLHADEQYRLTPVHETPVEIKGTR
jgi:cation diffusion facilitator CzcD-associated flavoprotein CzcO